MSLSLEEITRKAMPFECLECPLKVIMMRPARVYRSSGEGLWVRNWDFCSFIMGNYRKILRKKVTFFNSF